MLRRTSQRVEIEKTASVEQTDPGKSFTYTLDVENVSDDSAAEGVVVTDDIPADLKITDVSWPGRGRPERVPELGELRGHRAERLPGTAGRSRATCSACSSAGRIRAGTDIPHRRSPSRRPSIRASTASVITNVAVVDYYTFGDPEDPGRDADDAMVTLSCLPPTGGSPVLPLVIFGFLAMLAGVDGDGREAPAPRRGTRDPVRCGRTSRNATRPPHSSRQETPSLGYARPDCTEARHAGTSSGDLS